MIKGERLVGAAMRIAKRLQRTAIRLSGECTWEVTVASYDHGKYRGKTAEAGPGLYQGNSGIALFLAEYMAMTNDRTMVETIRGALRRAARLAAEPTFPEWGFYSGRVGVAYAAARIGVLLGDSESREICESLIPDQSDQAVRDVALDVIAGSAGGVLGLVTMGADYGVAGALAAAARAGQNLLRSATRHVRGWSWPAGGAFSSQDLCGYAHGASGFAHAFLELYGATGDPTWSFAALRAIQYEKDRGPGPGDQWDYRQPELAALALGADGIDEIKQRVMRGEALPLVKASAMRAWCHGAPGVAFVRLRAAELGITPAECREDASASLDRTRESLESMKSYSLCHGRIGNAEALYEGVRRGFTQFEAAIESAVSEGLDRFDHDEARWPSGLMGQVPDPSLLLGEAGVGLSLLRFANADIPSVLFLRPHIESPSRHLEPAGEAAVKEVEQLFPVFTRAHVRLSQNRGTPKPTNVVAGPLCACDAMVTGADAVMRELLEDAQHPEREWLTACHAFDDYIPHLIEELALPAFPDSAWAATTFSLAPHVRVVSTKWAWREWLASADERPAEHSEFFLIHRRARGVKLSRISTATASLMELLRFPRTGSDLIDRLAEDGGLTASQVVSFVGGTLKMAVEAGAVRMRTPNQTE